MTYEEGRDAAMKSFDELLSARSWSPIRGCPGRFVLRGGPCRLSPRDIVGDDGSPGEHVVDGAPDPVIVARIEGGGLISFRKEDGSFIHTLNTVEGFERKLRQLGIEVYVKKMESAPENERIS